MSRESAEPRTTSRNAAACAASHLDAEAEAPAAGGAEEELERRARKAAGQARARFVATTGSASYELLAYESQRDANIAALQAFLGVLGLSDSGVAPAGASAPPRVPRGAPATLTCPTCGRTIKLEDNCHDPARVRGMVGRRSSELTMQVTMRVGYHSASGRLLRRSARHGSDHMGRGAPCSWCADGISPGNWRYGAAFGRRC